MGALALVLMALGICMMAGHQLTQKWILTNQVLSKGEILVIQHGLGIPILISAFLWSDWGEYQVNPKMFWGAVAGTSLVNVLIQYANVKSRQLAEISLVAPIQAMTPLLLTASVVLFREFPSRIGLAGIILTSFGVYVHLRGENVKGLKELFAPLGFGVRRLLRTDFISPDEYDKACNKRTALRWAFFSALGGTFGLIFDALVARNGSVATGFIVQSIFLTSWFATLNLNREGGERKLISASGVASMGHFKKYWKAIIGLAVFWGLHLIFVQTSFRLAQIAYIGTLKRLTILVAVIGAYFFLGEKSVKRRIWPVLSITVGAVLLASDPAANRIVTFIEDRLVVLTDWGFLKALELFS